MKNCKLTTRHKFIQWGATLVWALLYSLHAALHFDNRFLEGLNLWHGSKSSGLFILIVIIELSELWRSKLERKSVLFFLIVENTRSSPALLCGIVKTPNATLLRFGSFSCKLPHIMSMRWYVTVSALSLYIYVTQKISFYHSTSLCSVYLILHLTFKAITCASTSEI